MSASKTLLYPFAQGALAYPEQGRQLYLNADAEAPELKKFPHLLCQQFFKPSYNALEGSGYKLCADLNDIDGKFDIVLLQASKSVQETQFYLAYALSSLADDGLVMIAADNKGNAGRLKKWLEQLGISHFEQDSKYKAKVFWARKTLDWSLHQALVDQWLGFGTLSQQEAHGLYACAGLYGWNKIDQGSKLLIEHIPEKIGGVCADFGCGYGYLSHYLVKNHNKIKKIDVFDADYRAIESIKRNLSEFNADIDYFWDDLTQNKPMGAYERIIMNPPFHEGKKQDSEIGVNFIRTAAKSLRNRGDLYMVANIHLPYEAILAQEFTKFDVLARKNGFKVLHAVK